MTSNQWPKEEVSDEERSLENLSVKVPRIPWELSTHVFTPNAQTLPDNEYVPNPFVLHTMTNARCIILDIEGTITSLKFVQDTLVPFVNSHLADYIIVNWETAEIQEIVEMIYKQSLEEETRCVDGFELLPPLPQNAAQIKTFQRALVDHVKWQMEKNFKSVGLKMLQGLIWIIGYESGDLTGELYADVPEAIRRWHGEGKKIYIYSSATVEVQRLHLRNSVYGNMEPFINDYFDTKTIGLKTETKSYFTLLEIIKENPRFVVYFTDRPREIFAAKPSGMHVALLMRKEFNPYIAEEKEFLCHESWRMDSFQNLTDFPPLHP